MTDIETIEHLKGIIVNAVSKAKSGHPGGALSSLDFAYILFTEYLKFDPDDSNWQGRDRFILSAGHESMLLYSLLMAIGYIQIDDIKNFRQLHSCTPGHPENLLTKGVECATGPLGQGAAMSVGFAIASRHLSSSLDSNLFSNRTWSLLGDGCMQEDVTLGAASLAGHLKLSSLIWYYDRNKKQISGSIDRVTSNDDEKIFKGLGWNVITIDGHSHEEIRSAIETAQKTKNQPTLIIGNTVIASGVASLEGSHKTHGSPLPSEEREKSLSKWNLNKNEPFAWPSKIQKHFQRNFSHLANHAKEWKLELKTKLESDEDFSKKYCSFFDKVDTSKLIHEWDTSTPLATRSAFGSLIHEWTDHLPNLIGGSADLDPSNMTEAFVNKVGDFSAENPMGRNIAFGVREFPMSAITNGLALYGGLIPFDATFLTFSDYSRPAIRLGALQEARVIHELTHDSFYLGEDGPTHQPIEHIASLRAIPNLNVIRPCDAKELEILLAHSLTINKPSCFCLTRQKVPHVSHDKTNKIYATRGAWVIQEASSSCELVIFATGSELSLALLLANKISELLGFEDKIQVVSVPCWELFFEQDSAYQKKILVPKCHKRISIEAGTTFGWERFVGMDGLTIGIDTFGASAPSAMLEEEFGFSLNQIFERSKKYLAT